MKLPKFELKISRAKRPVNTNRVQKEYAKGKRKYILHYVLMNISIYGGIKLLIELFTGHLYTIVPGFPVHILFHMATLFGILTWVVLASVFGYFKAKNLWKRIEIDYQAMIETEHESPKEEADPSVLEKKTPLFLRNLE